MFGINRQKLKASHEANWLLLDLFMMGLLLLNLGLIIFDSLYATQVFRQTLDFISPALAPAYEPLHQNFLLIDLAFVAVFLSEFMLRWLVAIRRNQYARWYFFPFIHWYDLIGCIPLASTRIFRFLRIFSILYRLNKYQIINLHNTRLFQFFHFYYQALLEELSDRIVVKVLSDVQKELADGTPLLDELAEKVIAGRRQSLVRWAACVLNQLGQSIENAGMQDTLRQHIETSVAKAVRDNKQVSSLNLVPVLGGHIEQLLERTVADIVLNAIVNLLKDLDGQKVDHFIEHGLVAASDEEVILGEEIMLVVNDCLELVKKHVAQQKWKQKL